MLKKFFNREITKRNIIILIPIIVLQLLLPVRSIALFLIEDLHIPFAVLALIESVTVPISILFICLYIIQKLRWRCLSKNAFSLGFVVVYAFNLLLSSQEYLFSSPVPFPLPRFLDEIFELFYKIFEILGSILFSFYVGWGGWTMMGLYVCFIFLVIMPICAGITFNLFYCLYKKFENKKSH